MKTFRQFMSEMIRPVTKGFATTAAAIKQDHRLDMAALVSQVHKDVKSKHPDADPKTIAAWKKKHVQVPK